MELKFFRNKTTSNSKTNQVERLTQHIAVCSPDVPHPRLSHPQVPIWPRSPPCGAPIQHQPHLDGIAQCLQQLCGDGDRAYGGCVGSGSTQLSKSARIPSTFFLSNVPSCTDPISAPWKTSISTLTCTVLAFPGIWMLGFEFLKYDMNCKSNLESLKKYNSTIKNHMLPPTWTMGRLQKAWA